MVRNSEFADVAGKVGRVGTAAALAFALAVPPVALTSTPALAVDSSSNAVAAAGAGKSLCESQIHLSRVIVQMKAAGVSGAEAAERYLTGQGFTKADVLGMDVAAIAQIDAGVAAEISWLQGVLTTPVPEEVPAPALPEDDADEGAQAPDEGGDAEEGGPEEGGAPEDGTDADAPAKPADPAEGDDATGDKPAGDATDSADKDADKDDTAEETPKVPELVVPHPVFGGLAADTSAGDKPAYPQWSYNGDTTYVPHNIGVNMTTEKFIAVIGEQARQIADESGLYASVMIAQAILESASGNSALASAPNNNLFGIKGAYNGGSVNMRTIEYDGDGMMYVTNSDFRSYPTLRDSLTDYALLLTNSMGGFYRGAWKLNAETYVDACDFLQGRYATDIAYSAKLQDLIVTYDLTRYDEPLAYEMLHSYEVVATDRADQVSSEADLESGELQMEQRDLVDLMVEVTSHLGEDYVWGGTTPGSFDCSGLMQYSYRQAMGVEIPRTTHYQCIQGDDVDFADLHMGDLVFFLYEDDTVGHVGMYLAEGCYIEAPEPGDVIKVTSMSEKMPSFAKRIVETKPFDAGTVHKSTSERWDKAVALIRTQQASDAADALPISVGGKRD